MAGVHGVVVPLPWLYDLGAWIPGLRQLAAGIPRGLGEAVGAGVLVSKSQVGWIAALLLIVWFAPNTKQIVQGASAILEDRRSPPRRTFLQWTPSASWAMVTACMLTASFLGMARVTEFLYFQF
jgi:hypothetical protein